MECSCLCPSLCPSVPAPPPSPRAACRLLAAAAVLLSQRLPPFLPPLLQALVGLRALEQLDACGNQLKRGGACALAKACARKPGLALLALDENEISEAGLDALRVRCPPGPAETLVLGVPGPPLPATAASGPTRGQGSTQMGRSGRDAGRRSACPRACSCCCMHPPVCPWHPHLWPVQEIMAKIGKPQALGPLDDNMADDDEEDEEIDDGIEIDDAAGDDLAAALGAAHI